MLEVTGFKRLVLSLFFPEVFEQFDKLYSEKLALTLDNKELQKNNGDLKTSIRRLKRHTKTENHKKEITE